MKSKLAAVIASLVLAQSLAPSLAHAHLAVTSPTPRTTMQKTRHCGDDVPRANVATFVPGQTLTITWDETIDHPGWYRISFQENGEVFRIPPGDAAGVPAGFPTENMTGMTDPTNGSLILLDRIADRDTNANDREYQATITLPNVECSNCTLQVIQVMTDKSPYITTEASDDIYFQCVDLVLSSTAPDAGSGGSPDASPGSPDAGSAAGPDAGDGSGSSGGGCATGNGLGGLGALGAVGVLLASRRRRAR